jgi:hypothetical protein
LVLFVAAALTLALAQGDAAPSADELRRAAYKYAYSRRGSPNAQFVCHGVGEILSMERIGRHHYSARYDVVMYYNDPTLPRPNIKRIVVKKIGNDWVWVSGDEPTCENMVL